MEHMLESFDKENSKYHAALYNPSEGKIEPVWFASGPNAGIRRTFLAVDDHLFIGDYTGMVLEVSVPDGKVVHHAVRHRGFSKIDFPIRGFAFFEGKVYDASYAGLYESSTDRMIDDRLVSSIEVIDGRLCIVPHGANSDKLMTLDSSHRGESDRKSNAGNLVDVLSGDVLMKGVEPFDGSGCSPGKHFTYGSVIYSHHGDYPGERFTIRDLHDARFHKEIGVWTSERFAVHAGDVYDVRWVGNRERKGETYMQKAVVRSDCSLDDEEGMARGLVKYLPNAHVTGMVSGSRLGLLVSLFHEKQQKSSIVALPQPYEPLMKRKGGLRISELVRHKTAPSAKKKATCAL